MKNQAVLLTATLLFLSISALPPLPAQSATPAGQPRRVLVFVEQSQDAELTPVDLRLLKESFLLQLAEGAPGLHVLDAGESGTPRSDRERSDLAISAQADAWISLALAGSMARLSYSVRAFDLVTRKNVETVELSRSTPTRARDLQRALWRETVQRVAGGFETVEFGTAVTVIGAPGTAVRGLTDEELVLDEEGTVTLSLPNPAAYSLRATHAEYYPVTAAFNLQDQPRSITLDQQPAPRFFGEAFLTNFSFPGISFGVYPVRERLFARLALASYVAGVYVSGDSEIEVPFFVSYPLTHVELHTAIFVNASDAAVRFYAGAGGALRLVHSKEYFGLDPLSPGTANLIAGIQVAPIGIVRFFLELTPTLYFTGDPALMAASHRGNYEPFHAAAVLGGYTDILSLRIGVRLQR